MRASLLAATASVLATPLAAYAQGTPSQGQASSEENSADATNSDEGLGDIIVTAQRREENLQRAAVSVDVLQGSDLIAAGLTQPARLGEFVPGLTIRGGAAGNLIFVRGVGNFTVTPNADPATAFNYDGVYLGRPSSTNGFFFDLERVEVLKGPQGTLYGRNATGGAINVLPTQPRVGEFSGYVTASYGNYDAVIAEGALNAPLGDNGALRASGAIVRRDGYLKDGTSDERTESARVQLKSELTPDLTVRVSGDYAHIGGASFGSTLAGSYAFNPATSSYIFTPSGLAVNEGTFTPAAQAYRTSLTAGTARRRFNPAGPFPFQSNDFYGSNAQIDLRTGVGTLTVIPAWRSAELDNLISSGFTARTRERNEQFSLEARLTGSRLGIFDYVLGGFYFDEEVKSRQAINVSFLASFLDNRYSTRSFAAFSRLTAHVTDQLRLVGGLRYTEDKKRFVGATTNFVVACALPACPAAPLLPFVESFGEFPFGVQPAGAPPRPLGGGAVLVRGDRADNSRLKSDRFTYRAAAEFDVAPRSLVFASVETGYRSGGFSPATGFETYAPEFITAYTLGSKNRFFDDRLQFNVEAFLWNYRNQQISYVGVDLSGRAANLTQNIGRSRIKGVEVEARVLATPTTLLSADVQYLDARYLEFSYSQLAGAVPPLTGCAFRPAGTLVTVDCSGQRSYNSPKWTINLAAQQTVRLGDFKAVAGVDTQYRSSEQIAFDYLAAQRTQPNWRTNAQLLFGPADDRWSIAAFVRNIENNQPLVAATLIPATMILQRAVAAPRLYGVRGSIRF